MWAALHNAETAMYEARMRFAQNVTDVQGVLDRALRAPHQRGTALRFLQIADESVRRALFATLLGLATVSHSDLNLVRAVIQSIDRDWVNDQLEQRVPRLLETAGAEEYRRLAELLKQLNSPALPMVLSKAYQQPDEDIREVAADFFDDAFSRSVLATSEDFVAVRKLETLIRRLIPNRPTRAA
jgi:hypothetical protein